MSKQVSGIATTKNDGGGGDVDDYDVGEKIIILSNRYRHLIVGAVMIHAGLDIIYNNVNIHRHRHRHRHLETMERDPLVVGAVYAKAANMYE